MYTLPKRHEKRESKIDLSIKYRKDHYDNSFKWWTVRVDIDGDFFKEITGEGWIEFDTLLECVKDSLDRDEDFKF